MAENQFMLPLIRFSNVALGKGGGAIIMKAKVVDSSG